MKKTWRKIGLGLLIIISLAAIGFTVWAVTPPLPEPTALNSLSANENVDYQRSGSWLVFTPRGSGSNIGLILYPGGRVDPRSYAPHARAIAEAGFTVVVVPMPLNFAFLGIDRANEVIDTFQTIDTWAIGGHSLGGAMAVEFADANPSQVEGLILWASYPAETTDLSGLDLSVLSIYASNDGLATSQDIEESRARLPQDTNWVEIEGGNHAGFGWYGPQNGDGPLTINKSEQQAQIVSATVEFLDQIRNE